MPKKSNRQIGERPKEVMFIRINADLRSALKVKAKKLGVTQNQIIEEALMENIFGVDVKSIVFEVFNSVGLPNAEASTEAIKFLGTLDATAYQAGSENDIRQMAAERLNQHLAWRGHEPN